MARVLMAGSSGFLGTHLRAELTRRGHEVTALVRRPARAGESSWDPYSGHLDQAVVDAADVVINLAGSPTLGNPHSGRWASQLRESRVATTQVLARAVAASDRRPAFLAGNGVAWYGDHGDQPLDESADSRGHAFMTGVCRDWEEAARPAVRAGARVCVLRTTPVMDASSAPLRQLLPLFRLGLGARLGGGHQYMPMISLRDWVGAVAHLVEHDDVSGPVNLSCVDTPTNAEFTRALARAVGRPSLLAVPSAALRLGAGRLAPEVLSSVDVRPAVLLGSGYVFQDPDVTAVLGSALGRALPA